jgi:hypothetical protein
MDNANTYDCRLNRIDQEFTRVTSRLMPFSADVIWKHLTRSYFEFQSYLHASQSTASPVRLVPGTTDGVGATIEFDFNGQPVLEKLVTQDDFEYVWRIIVPGETAIFKRYVATLKLIPVTDRIEHEGKTLVTLELNMVLQDANLASQIFSAVDPLILERLPRLEEYVQLKQGFFVLNFAENVEVETTRLWSIVSSWNDVSWVLGAQENRVDPNDPYHREIALKGGFSVVERLVAKDDDSRTLTYQMLKSSFPVNFYKARLHLEAVPGGKTAFQYYLLFVPLGLPVDQVKKVIWDRLAAGVQFINSNLGSKTGDGSMQPKLAAGHS